jgi:enoyl-CoA hydratase/carnithine racemase
MTDVLVEEHNGVMWVTLNRPGVRNALSRDVNIRLQEIASDLEQRLDEIRVVVLTGTGDKAFSAGADLKERKGVTAAETGPYLNAIANAIEGIAAIKQPTICMMNGSAYGGGLELAMACDFRVLVEGAEVGLTEVRLGIMPGAGGTQRMPRLVGEARAKELIMLGRRISAARAAEIGLVHQVVARDQLRGAVDALLADLAACAPISVMSAKAAIETGYGKSLDEALGIERECYERTLYSEDRDEGLAAFAEGRPPRYQGR